MYAKLQNNVLKRAPNQVSCNGSTIFNPPPDILIKLGYLPVTYTDPPAGKHYESSWEQTDAAILQARTLMDDIPDTEQLTMEDLEEIIKEAINSD